MHSARALFIAAAMLLGGRLSGAEPPAAPAAGTGAPRTERYIAMLADKTCTDVFVEAHARLSRGLRFSRPHVAVLQFSRGPAPSPQLTRLTRRNRGNAVRATENELALSTVLRI